MSPRSIADRRQAEELAILLRILREQACMTQEELADRSGMSVRAISNLERGRTTKPQRRSIESLAAALLIEGDSLEKLRVAARERAVAQCPVCATRWRLDQAFAIPAVSVA